MTPAPARTILITGAASGIGAATARRLAAPGARLVLHTRKNRDGLDAVAEACRTAGAEVATAFGDLSEEETPERVVAEGRAAFGSIDQLVANAGSADRRRFGELAAADLVAAQAAMPLAFFRLATALLPDLEASSVGRVVAVSSFVAHVFGINDTIFPSTAAAKAAIEALAKALAIQLAPSGATVNVVVPGYTRKDPGAHHAIKPDAWQAAADATPMRKLALPADVAAAIAFFLAADAGHVTGQTLMVDGGLSLR
ncbi:MAG: SDR family NAD(P)-dependent oxidoreductase [Alphaproteobacteria bacterium]